jgi:8-oxo-dGTP pyrophosphatase MutT (NUDIX family)
VEREFSAGGVLIKSIRGRAMVAAIRPQGKPEGTWALPKGNIDPGETPAETAVREVLEETGVQGRLVEKLGDVKYTYTRRGCSPMAASVRWLRRRAIGSTRERAPQL